MLRAVGITLLVVASTMIGAGGQAAPGPSDQIYVSYLSLASEGPEAEGSNVPTSTPVDWIDWNGANFFGPCRGDCSISLSGGRQITTAMTRIMLIHNPVPAWEWHWGDAGIVAGAFSRRMVTFWNALNIEPEFGIAKRVGDMKAVELWGAVVIRWTAFPWNDYLKTTIAISEGFSLATQVDTVERDANVDHAGSILLNYFSPEITLALPAYENYELVVGVHHRSGLYGVINNVNAGTQFGTVGLRVHF